ncbi:unnamed protein product, partial [Effrenium voratum]
SRRAVDLLALALGLPRRLHPPLLLLLAPAMMQQEGHWLLTRFAFAGPGRRFSPSPLLPGLALISLILLIPRRKQTQQG